MEFVFLWQYISLLGDPYLWSVLAVLFVVFYFMARDDFPKKMKTFREFLKIFIPALIITMVVVQGMKIGFNAERPCTPCESLEISACDPYCPITPSFPSGHSAIIFAFFTSSFLIVRKPSFLALSALPLIVVYSRYVLGVHTLIDIFVGSIIGISISVIVWTFMKRHYISL
ncbi:MAG: phosphatase PAP2 family protein [Nanoarchaeota archaeon]